MNNRGANVLIHREHSLLLHIDLQVKLAVAIHEMESVLTTNIWLTDIANHLTVPVIATLQYPAGLGLLLPEIASRVKEYNITEKIHFSAITNGQLQALPDFSHPQIILTGIETHVCVLQTAMDLLSIGKEVFVVAEAVGSRRTSDRDLALERMRQEGCKIVSREMVVFEWLREAGTEDFKKISKNYVR